MAAAALRIPEADGGPHSRWMWRRWWWGVIGGVESRRIARETPLPKPILRRLGPPPPSPACAKAAMAAAAAAVRHPGADRDPAWQVVVGGNMGCGEQAHRAGEPQTHGRPMAPWRGGHGRAGPR